MVAITYVSNGSWGTGQGAPLTAAQHDGNMYAIAQAIAAAEADIDAIVSVSSISSSGNVVTFHLTNGSTIDVAFDLPSFRYRGAWLNSTAYAVGDIITVAGSGTYLCAVAHDSPSTGSFNPEAADSSTDGGGEERLWTLLLPEPDLAQVVHFKGSSFPASQALEEDDVFWDSTYGLFVVELDHTSASSFDPDALSGSTRLYRRIAAAPFAPIATVTDTTYTVTRDDVGKYLRFTNALGCTIYFDDDDFDAGMEIHFEHAGGDAATLYFTTASTDINVRPQRTGYDAETPYDGAVVTAKFISSSEVKLIGPQGSVSTA